MQLLLWQNLIFAMPAVLALVYLLVLGVSGGFGEQDGDAQADHGPAGDHDMSHDAGGEPGDAAGHDIQAAEGQAGHEVNGGAAVSVARFFLLGRVPAAVILVSAMLLWGAIGLAANIAGSAVILSMVLAFVGAVLGTRFVAATVAKIMPATESYSVPREALVGQEAVVTYKLTLESGEVRLVDRLGIQRDLPCRSGQDRPEVAAGAAVRLVLYDKDKEAFIGWPV